MLRSSVNFILKLGKQPPLQRQPLNHLSEEDECQSSSLPSVPKILQAPVKIEQPQHSNQMSS